jgi:hypothetical protein
MHTEFCWGNRKEDSDLEDQRRNLTIFYRSTDVFNIAKCMRLRWAGHVAYMKEARNAYIILLGKPHGRW